MFINEALESQSEGFVAGISDEALTGHVIDI